MTEALDKTMTEPIWDEFDENTHRIRRNLLIFASILLTVKFAHLYVDYNAQVFGFPLKGLTTNNLLIILAVLTFYHFSHFVLVTWNYYLRWRVRITGWKDNYVNQFGVNVESSDFTIKQSTLYGYPWWLSAKGTLDYMIKKLEEIETIINNNHSQLSTKDVVQNLRNLENTLQPFLRFTQKGSEMDRSLERFNKWFWYLQRAQKIRWMGIEVALPLYLGIVSLIWI